ncbi:unnamed protein product [Peronospora belbahrii]|uniref:MARVEL domain-containing protein n=1 Tax=Peronospora belbahrii TaxID=622444 RepID=A0ABN8CRL0_9STRA|nr:unnamed protein product [Peronospora belbahrii]
MFHYNAFHIDDVQKVVLKSLLPLLASVTQQTTAGGQTVSVIVDSSALSFARIINFLAFVYAFAFLVFIEWLRLCVHKVYYYEKVMDVVILVCLIVATLLLLLSKITLHCRRGFGRFIDCGELYLAVAMSFLSILAFLCIVSLGKRDKHTEGLPNNGEQQQSGSRHNQVYSSHASPRVGATSVPVVTVQ